jgi:hypothetical protein
MGRKEGKSPGIDGTFSVSLCGFLKRYPYWLAILNANEKLENVPSVAEHPVIIRSALEPPTPLGTCNERCNLERN